MDPARRRFRRLAVLLVIAVLLSVAGTILLAARRAHREEAARERLARAADAGPRVLVAPVQNTPGERTVVLPGEVRAFWQTTLYARVAGYVRELAVDKGDRVRRGDVLARIASPETDRQVDQARSTLALRRRQALRARSLAPKGFVSRQDLDQANSDLVVAEAELRRIRSLQAYEVLRAPFDGVVTARYVDPGALVSATGSGQAVVEVSDPTRSRVLVYAGQDVAPFVLLGDRGELTIDQYPGVRVQARVQRTADALDPRTRTMLVELWPDPGGDFRLVPGLFVHVALRVRVPSLPAVPVEALTSHDDRVQVAIVRDGRLRYVDVEPGVNDGTQVQIRRGVAPGDRVAISPPSDLGDGAPVQPVEAAPQRQRGGGAPSRQARPPPKTARDGVPRRPDEKG
ncbi:efflux RND transporter periplasmic adaptor subunit [Anaeromyxobacter oryzisoli]|uniref:efflux RND transporter periplasmic adaptor subunit n=1 Tax=Anaeromyxobacter oryzisoli TaxID=2925408 RepID=UPI001F599695|nr:efflux RND transporter periplasmic adaptor subunit [Anaeromyxobacter sp. SG63]